MSKEHHLVIVPGLGDPTKPLEWITRNWEEKYGITPHVEAFGWQGEKNLFDARLKKLDTIVEHLLQKGYNVSLLGISAGGSAVFNEFYRRKNDIRHVVNVCGRLREVTNVHPTLDQAAKQNPIFKQSVLECEKGLATLTPQNKTKILTLRPFYDEVVPISTVTVEDATNKQIISAEHMVSIYVAMTIYARKIVEFLQEA